MGDKAIEATTIPSFNPSGDERVDWIKRQTEELIIYLRETEGLEPRRRQIAITNYEQAAMWAVKACFP